MTREEAIEKLKHERDEDIFAPTFYRDKIHEALTMAIKALSEPTIPLSVIEKIHDAIDDMDCEDLTFYDGVNKLGNAEYVCREEVHEIIDKAVRECGT